MSFIQEIGQILGNFERVGDKFDRDGWQFAKKLSDAWILRIQIVHAILSGDYLRSINWKAGESATDFQQFIVDSSSNPDVENYSGFVEGGTKFMAARYPAEGGIESVDFVQTIDAFIDYGLGQGADNL